MEDLINKINELNNNIQWLKRYIDCCPDDLEDEHDRNIVIDEIEKLSKLSNELVNEL